MKSYKEFPKCDHFLRVLRSYPKSALIYLKAWGNKDAKGKTTVYKDNVRKEYFVSPTMFRNMIFPLMSLSVIDFSESSDAFSVCFREDRHEEQ